VPTSPPQQVSAPPRAPLCMQRRMLSPGVEGGLISDLFYVLETNSHALRLRLHPMPQTICQPGRFATDPSAGPGIFALSPERMVAAKSRHVAKYQRAHFETCCHLGTTNCPAEHRPYSLSSLARWQADEGDDSDHSDGEPAHGEHHHSRWRDLLPGLLTHRRLHRSGYRRVAWSDEQPGENGVLHASAPSERRRTPAGMPSGRIMRHTQT